MSKLFNRPIAQESGPQTSGLPLPAWQVKLSNGAVYGPIETSELRTWAEECRLAPGDQVSSDNVHWVNVETLPELEMHWMVEMASGEIFGPVNLHAVVDFSHSRLVLPSSRLTNQLTGEAATVADLVLPLIHNAARDDFAAGAPVVAVNSRPADRLIKFNQNTTPARPPPDQHKEKLQLRIELLQATVDESKACIKQLQDELDSQQAQTLKLRDNMAALEKTHLLKLGDVQKNNDVVANMIEKAVTQVQALNAALAEQEQRGANETRDLDSLRSEKESRIQSLTRQIEALTADQTAMRSALEQNRAEFEQAHRETRKLATTGNELNKRISVFDSQVQTVSENLAASAAEVAGPRERIGAMTGEHLQARIENLTGSLDALNPELEAVRGELTGREADIMGLSERMISMEKNATEAGNEAEQQKILCQQLQEQLGQAEGEFKRREMPRVTEKTKLELGSPGRPARKSVTAPAPDRQEMNRQEMNLKPGKNILVVDDSEVIQQLIIKLAEQYGASVTAVASARDVTRILAEKSCRFDLFIIDLILPEITGWEIIGTLRARPETKNTPIVILTGSLLPNEKEKILQKANAVIEKSKFTITDFNQVLNQWL